MAANCRMPAVTFTLEYLVSGNELTVDFAYRIADYIEGMPRIGLEFGVNSAYSAFSYVGYGPYESYIDKHPACEYGYYRSTAAENYESGYVRPQESGSHYACQYLALDGLLAVTAENPFSCSVNPYTTEQLRTVTHAADLPANELVTVCIDVAMCGVGSASCGPVLEEQYEIPKQGRNCFKLVF